MQKLKILQGIPASGKSTWAKQYVLDFPEYVRVCRDDLRRMRGKYWIPDQEDMITKFEFACIENALDSGFNVLVDATNLNPKTIKKFQDLISRRTSMGYQLCEIEYKKFDTPLEECLRRDALRGDEAVGASVIKDFYYKYFVDNKPQEKSEVVIQNKDLPHAIICDLDGTLCLHNGRGPFEYLKCNTDILNEGVASILSKYLFAKTKDVQIIYVSGREDLCREMTETWIRVYGLFDGLLYMRKTGDHRKDTIIKKEIFDQYIKGKYYVEFCIDDRSQVVDFWRSIGLTCLQCAKGDF